MKRSKTPPDLTYDRFRRLLTLVADALAGRMGMPMMLLSYASFAVLLLAYVSTQVYTSSLMEDISELQREERLCKEHIGLLMGDYAALASRSRIARYCENELGMVQADTHNMKRVAVEQRRGNEGARPQEFDQLPVQISNVLGADLSGITEVIRQ